MQVGRCPSSFFNNKWRHRDSNFIFVNIRCVYVKSFSLADKFLVIIIVIIFIVIIIVIVILMIMIIIASTGITPPTKRFWTNGAI